MPINWNAIVEGTSGGVAAATLLAGFAIYRSWAKNALLRRQLRRSVSNHSIGESMDGITIGVPNLVGKDFKVRQVAVTTAAGGIALNPTADVRTIGGKRRKLSRAERRQLKEGKIVMIPGEYQLGYTRPEQQEDLPKGFASIAPFTSRDYVLPAQILDAVVLPITAVHFTIEIVNRSSNVELVEFSSERNVDALNGFVKNFTESLSTGEFDERRRQFGLQPLKRPFLQRNDQAASQG